MASLMPICADLVGLKSENIKISSALIRPKWAYKQQTHIFPTYFACPKEAAVRREREPKEQRSDRSKKRSPKEVLPRKNKKATEKRQESEEGGVPGWPEPRATACPSFLNLAPPPGVVSRLKSGLQIFERVMCMVSKLISLRDSRRGDSRLKI